MSPQTAISLSSARSPTAQERWSGSNVLVFDSAFSGEGGVPLCASVVYTINQGSFMQDIVFTGRLIRQCTVSRPIRASKSSPELYEPPEPDRLEMPIRIERDQSVRERTLVLI